MKTPVSELPVMEKCCKTCPFKKVNGIMFQDVALANTVIERNLFKSQQICHGTELDDRTPQNRCRGYWDYSTPIYRRLGMPQLINPPKNNES